MKLYSVFTAAVAVLLAVCAPQLSAAPFAKTIEFTQPNGEVVQIWGQGDDFYAVFETLDGFTVVFDQNLRAYVYADLNADATELVSTGVPVGAPRPAALQPHLRINRAAAAALAGARQQEWEQQTGIRDRWNALKMERRTLEQDLLSGPVTLAPPSHHTVGEITGIVLLIDFDDDARSITRTEIDQYCNLPGYGGYGNNGSVRDYFYEVSNGSLIYTNVVLQYVRIPNSVHPKSYYTNPARGAGESGNELIHDALNILTAQPNYQTEIAPLIDLASINSQGQALALNVFYTGGNGGVWAQGLWPHMWGLYAAGAYRLTDRTTVFTYQITNMGNELSIGTFCHENGHMICGYPDLYDYDYDSVGGAGMFCIMGSGGHGKNPSQVCGYLKYASGWTTTIEVPPFTYEQASVAARISHPDFNKIYRTTKPGTDTEYYLFEARARIDRDAQLPAQGLLIWHVDELGDRDNQSIEYNTQHLNYECSLVQADGAVSLSERSELRRCERHLVCGEQLRALRQSVFRQHHAERTVVGRQRLQSADHEHQPAGRSDDL
jgi:M6 family metalloprotease-like protein